jgi:hypothetical protein
VLDQRLLVGRVGNTPAARAAAATLPLGRRGTALGVG